MKYFALLTLNFMCLAVAIGQTVSSTTARTNSSLGSTTQKPSRLSYIAALLEEKRRLHKQLTQNVGNAIKKGGEVLSEGVVAAMNSAHRGFDSFISNVITTLGNLRKVGNQAVNSVVNGINELE